MSAPRLLTMKMNPHQAPSLLRLTLSRLVGLYQMN
jgi:hypothetical protein